MTGPTVSFTLLTMQRQKLPLVNSQSEESDTAKDLKLFGYAHISQHDILKICNTKTDFMRFATVRLG